MSSSNAPQPKANHEQGDDIINWHLQYCSTILLQTENNVNGLSNLIKSEISKIKTDAEYIKNRLPGPHDNLLRLKATDQDLLKALDKLKEASDLLRRLSARSAKRII